MCTCVVLFLCYIAVLLKLSTYHKNNFNNVLHSVVYRVGSPNRHEESDDEEMEEQTWRAERHYKECYLQSLRDLDVSPLMYAVYV